MKNFIIWTLQRSGGTSFTLLVEKMGNYEHVLHEPFNRNQVFGQRLVSMHYIKKKFRMYGSCVKDIHKDYPTVVFKHCFELHNFLLNNAIFEHFSRHGYKHIYLVRDNRFMRQVSLEIATQTGAWDKDQMISFAKKGKIPPRFDDLNIQRMINNEIRCRKMEVHLEKKLRKYESDVVRVSYDSIFSGEMKKRLMNLEEIADALNISANSSRKDILDLIMNQKQLDKSSYDSIPNMDAARQKFTEHFES